MSETIDCRSEEGITIGLIDAIISISRVLKDRNFQHPAAQEAVKDLAEDEDLASILYKVNFISTQKEVNKWAGYEVPWAGSGGIS